MNHILVRETSSEIRAISRSALRGSWPIVTLGIVIYYVLSSTIPQLLSIMLPSVAYSFYYELIDDYITVSYVANLYNFLLMGAFEVGICSFFLAFFRRKDANPAYVFNGFENFLKAFALMIVQGFFIFLWSLLFLIPGIIAAFRYSQAFYILADHPEKGVMECIRESKYLMGGNKGKFFCLNLSFIGWALLAVLISTFLPAPSGILAVFTDLIYSIPYYFYLTYLCMAQTVFYDLVTGNLVAKSDFRSDDAYHF